MEALTKACHITGTNPLGNNLQLASNFGGAASVSSSSDSESDGDHDLELVRSIRKRFAITTDMTQKPLCVLPPDSSDADDCDEDYETLRAIQGVLRPTVTVTMSLLSQEAMRTGVEGLIEARMKELKKVIERVKILKDFHVACKKRTGRALLRKKDSRAQLISVPKLRANSKFNEKKVPALYTGPPENVHVSSYRETMATFPDSMSGENWSKEEKENLWKGVKQQFQGMFLQLSVELFSSIDGSSEDSNNIDSIISSIKDLDFNPEKVRLFLPKVYLEQLAAMYVPGRSVAECQARTPFQCLARYQRSLNASILKREWTKEEDDQLRDAVETFGESNWQLVAFVMEGRTGTQCSNRWLKTLHPARKRVGKWTADEDKRMKIAANLFGPKTWKKVSRCVPGRTQVQCRERWINCLDPSLNMAGWSVEEDSKLETAIAEYGYCWSKVAACVPPRTDNQCCRAQRSEFEMKSTVFPASFKIKNILSFR